MIATNGSESCGSLPGDALEGGESRALSRAVLLTQFVSRRSPPWQHDGAGSPALFDDATQGERRDSRKMRARNRALQLRCELAGANNRRLDRGRQRELGRFDCFSALARTANVRQNIGQHLKEAHRRREMCKECERTGESDYNNRPCSSEPRDTFRSFCERERLEHLPSSMRETFTSVHTLRYPCISVGIC
eukprot:scaffold62036_cov32-Tisochrysis_lutea.AAC.3